MPASMPASIARSRPLPSMLALASQTMAALPRRRRASRKRSAMSPVPPATSSRLCPGRGAEAVDELRLPQAVDAAAHQIVHQIVALATTLSKTPRTRRAFSAAATRRKPKSVSRLAASWPDHSASQARKRYISQPCPSCPKSKPSAAAWRCASPAGASMRAEANRADLRRPLPPISAARVEGRRVERARRGAPNTS